MLQSEIRRLATQYPVVRMTGPRQSGKTTLCKTAFPDYTYINLEALSIREFATRVPKGFLAHYGTQLILDEIQRAAELPSYIQPLVDKTEASGQFILTASQQLTLTNTINQSLAGRTALLTLLPLSFNELYDTSPAILKLYCLRIS